MHTDQRNVLQTIALLKEHDIKKIVISPDTGNNPITNALRNDSFFTCHTISDGRTAGFFALGLALHGGKPSAVCCNAGAELLDIHPAVAEAYRQHMPLVVISLNGGEEGWMCNQTLQQQNVFGGFVKKFVRLPVVHSDEEERLCNLLINDALMETSHHGKGPVHISIPTIGEAENPATESLPKVRVITRYQGLNAYDREYDTLVERLNKYRRRMVIAGQMSLIYMFEKSITKLLYKHFAWLTEHTGNRTIPGMAIKNFDAALSSLPEKTLKMLRPDLVITYGGNIVSQHLREFLRDNPPKEHWHVSALGEVFDPYGCLTTVIEMDPFEFLERIAHLMENKPTDFPRLWESTTKELPQPMPTFSKVGVVGKLLKTLPTPSALHLGGSAVVKLAQLYSLPEGVEVCSNLATGGAEGTLATAIGYSVASDKLNFVITGGTDSPCSMNALRCGGYGCNLRILLLSEAHQAPMEHQAMECGFMYQEVKNEEEMEEAMQTFTDPNPMSRPLFLEVFTDKNEDARLLDAYLGSIKQK